MTKNHITTDAQPSVEAMKAAVELEIHAALGRVQTVEIGRMIQKAIDASQPSPVERGQMHLDGAFDKGREYGLSLARSSAGSESAKGSGVEMIDSMTPETLANWRDDGDCNAGVRAEPQAVPEIQNVGNSAAASDISDQRWAVNVLLEKIAEKFEGWDTFDLFRSEAAATVRGFKHDLSSQVSRPHLGRGE